MNANIPDYNYFIPWNKAGTLEFIKRTEHSSNPSNRVSCPITYHIYSATNNTELIGTFLTMDAKTGLLTVDKNTINTRKVHVFIKYDSTTWKTNDFTVSVIC
jgi:hypothetical protein